ncbi:hypothetical protein MIV092R [Invertebrate iridescent virus 3]|uniref:Uncharacterized protein 092R n=1 Tax=Invertebrate iridescent virus 3 TaxID=345201 RepID=092R_IIV3|nr:hypothetical protein MIV092R [Invertebrate iridescent virus 3]Q196W8.1 RecName: Full=Uncharacterized protein 092R [Invertebrate iridescent virus 3]ABF82122.1 hypothetical protein MIV092R [Invertebrate iridescent virus 3]
MKIDVVREMMAQRGFEEYKIRPEYMVGVNRETNDYIYIKIFPGKFELNTVREFLARQFYPIIDPDEKIVTKKTFKHIVQLVIISKTFQNSHFKEFREISRRIQLIRSDFFNINITTKAPRHERVPKDYIKNRFEIPIIKETDPNCIFYNFVKDDVIRVTRSDGDICYRLVK